MTDQNLAIQLFCQHTNYKEVNIKKIKEIHFGYTNKSFLITTNQKVKYQVRIAKNNKIIDRSVEYKISKLINNNQFVYRDEYGNMIKKWIEGYNPKFIFNKKQLLNKLIKAILEVHSNDINKIDIPKHDYLIYIDDEVKSKYQDWTNLYLKIIDKSKDLQLVLSHNDINPLNMIYTKHTKEIVLIDYEWARINNRYFDLSGFFITSKLNIKWLKYISEIYPNIEYQTLLEFCFVSAYFSYLWTFKVTESKKILKLRKTTLKQTQYFYSLIQDDN